MSRTKPEAGEYVPYYDRYISLVPAGDILEVLRGEGEKALALWRSVPESEAGFRYAPDKWSLRQVAGHVIDAERIFSYRALTFARNDQTPLPGFDENPYVENAAFDDVPFADLAAEFEHVRHATLLLFQHLAPEAWTRRGTASNNPVSVRALAYLIAGHELHHRAILRDRYLHRPA